MTKDSGLHCFTCVEMWHRHSQLSHADLCPRPGPQEPCETWSTSGRDGNYSEELIAASSLIHKSWNYNLTTDQRPDQPIILLIRHLAWFLAHLFPLSGRRIGSLALDVFCGSPVRRGGSLPGVEDCWPRCDLKQCFFPYLFLQPQVRPVQA